MKEKIDCITEYLSGIHAQTGTKVHLVAATKMRTVDEINAAISYGVKIVGENRAQEFRDKHAFISPEAEQHFIGHLQANKIKYVVGRASLIHSCDSLSLANEVSLYAERLGVVQDMLIEVNISRDSSKHGVNPNDVFELAKQLKTVKNVRFRGVMAVLPHVSEEKLVPYCREMKDIFDSLKQGVFGEDFVYLSMGMSEDYKIAIENGANMIRLGRAIFGDRPLAVKQEEC